MKTLLFILTLFIFGFIFSFANADHITPYENVLAPISEVFLEPQETNDTGYEAVMDEYGITPYPRPEPLRPAHPSDFYIRPGSPDQAPAHGGWGNPAVVYDMTGNPSLLMAQGIAVRLEPDFSRIGIRTEKGGESSAQTLDAASDFKAAYPFTQWEYGPGIRVKRWSPFIPGDLQTTSQPVTFSEMQVTNTSKSEEDTTVYISLTDLLGMGWKSTGFDNKEGRPMPYFKPVIRGDPQTHRFVMSETASGIVMEALQSSCPEAWKGQMALLVQNASGQEVSTVEYADPKDKASWEAMLKEGKMPESRKNPGINGCILAVKLKKLKPGETRTIRFSTVFDVPQDRRFARVFDRYYTKQYGDSGNNAFRIGENAFKNRREWLTRAVNKMKKVLDNPSIPKEIKQIFINELSYYIASGLLLTADGKFGCNESFIYTIPDTIDVRDFVDYLAKEFPEIEEWIMDAYGTTIDLKDPRVAAYANRFLEMIPAPDGSTIHLTYVGPDLDRVRKIQAERIAEARSRYEAEYHKPFDETDPGARLYEEQFLGVKKVEGIVTHDLALTFFGNLPYALLTDPDLSEYDRTTMTLAHRTAEWTNQNAWLDLNYRYVLQTARAFYMNRQNKGTDNIPFLERNWTHIKKSLVYARTRTKDGLPYHTKGQVETTYDNMRFQGYATVTSVLTIEAIQAAVQMGEELDQAGKLPPEDVAVLEDYRQWLKTALETMDEYLWDKQNKCYKFSAVREDDPKASPEDREIGDSYIMSDVSGFASELYGIRQMLPRDKLLSHLRKIYEVNEKRSRDNPTPLWNSPLWIANVASLDGGPIKKEHKHLIDQGRESWTGVYRSYTAVLILNSYYDPKLKELAERILISDHQNILMGGQGFLNSEAFRSHASENDYGRRATIYERALAISNVITAYEMLAELQKGSHPFLRVETLCPYSVTEAAV
ncbi:MAG: hypothetical protein JW774_05490 [Candidatus Aureabacteria bacterium]|nr:hypothetical protein [Candidatus Auribacterota bacterium]